MAHVNSKVRLTPMALTTEWTTITVANRCTSIELTADVQWEWCTDEEFKNQPRRIAAGIRELVAESGFSGGEAVCFVRAVDTAGTIWRKCVLKPDKGDSF